MKVTSTFKINKEDIETALHRGRTSTADPTTELEQSGMDFFDAISSVRNEDGTITLTFKGTDDGWYANQDPLVLAIMGWLAMELDEDSWYDANEDIKTYLDDGYSDLPCLFGNTDAKVTRHKDGSATVTFTDEYPI